MLQRLSTTLSFSFFPKNFLLARNPNNIQTFVIFRQPSRSRLAAGASEELSVGDRFRLATSVKLISRASECGIRLVKVFVVDISVD
jgi:hypothetical protein